MKPPVVTTQLNQALEAKVRELEQERDRLYTGLKRITGALVDAGCTGTVPDDIDALVGAVARLAAAREGDA
jgi:hypothetical protein